MSRRVGLGNGGRSDGTTSAIGFLDWVDPRSVYLGINLSNTMTVEMLAIALEQAMSMDGMTSEGARDLAEQVMNFFGYDDRFPDNFLRSEDRDLFNTLEEMSLVTVEAEDTTLMSGKFWRVYYWTLNYGRIQALVDDANKKDIPKQEGPKPSTEESLYDSVPDDIWHRD